jgi:hypothetical protein
MRIVSIDKHESLVQKLKTLSAIVETPHYNLENNEKKPLKNSFLLLSFLRYKI